MSLMKLDLLTCIFVLLVTLLIPCRFAHDVWNDIPCSKEYQPENCNMANLDPMTIDDFDRCAPARLPVVHRNYFLGASGRRETYKENKEAFRRIKIIPKSLKDVSYNEVRTTVLGMDVDFPVGLAPIAAQKLAHRDGELATVSGLAGMKTVMILSSYATTAIEDVGRKAKGTSVHLWMQIYLFKNRSLTAEIVRKAEKSGFKAIVLTADANIDASISCNARKRLKFPKGDGLVNLGETFTDISDSRATFWDIKWLKSLTTLPIIAKGILTGPDATLAINAGASAIMVSNHGGRQMDGTISTIDALPGVVDAVNKLFPRRDVYLDSGVRSGHDVYKALARGAKMVFVGRPIIWGLALNGSLGVSRMMNIFKSEFNETMLLAGVTKPSDIRRDSLLPQVPIISSPNPWAKA